MTNTRRNPFVYMAVYSILIIFVVIILIPIAHVFLSSFKTNEEINRVISLPSGFFLDNFKHVFKSKSATYGLINSMVITLAAMLISVIVSSYAGYAIGRRKEKIFVFLYLFFLSAMMIPVGSNLVSIYTLLKSLHLTDSRTGLTLIYAAQAIPMGVLLYTGFVKTVPREIDEASIIDGCGYIERFRLVISPLLKPVTVTFVVISAVNVWNDFLMPLLFITSESKRTLPLAVYTFTSSHVSDFGAIYAMLALAIVPPALFFLLMQKYFYQGITAGAVKG
jgi:raffinose/stachyose/melibiose transport system permease protein